LGNPAFVHAWVGGRDRLGVERWGGGEKMRREVMKAREESKGPAPVPNSAVYLQEVMGGFSKWLQLAACFR